MGQTVNAFKRMLENRKNELSQIQDEAQKKQKTAELILLTHMFNKCGNDWDLPEMKKQFETQIQNFNPNPKYTQIIERIKGNMDTLTARIATTEPRPFPEEMYPYAVEPGKLTDEKMKGIRNELYRKGYPFDVFRVPPEGVCEEQKKAIENELGVKVNDIAEKVTPLANKFEGANGEVLKRFNTYTSSLGMMTGRAYTNASTFRFYLIARKGMSLSDTLKLQPDAEGFEDLFNEFETFVKNHPILDTANKKLSNDERDANVKEWLDVFSKASDAFANYQIPDIDYNNPAAIALYRDELLLLPSFITDLEQQVEPFLNAAAPSLTRLAGEDMKLKAKMRPAQEIRKFASAFTEANTLSESLTLNNPTAAAKNVAVQRVIFANEVAPKYKGKLGSQLNAEVTVRSLYDGYAQLQMVNESTLNPLITPANSKEYLKNGGGNFKDIVLNNYQSILVKARKEQINQNQVSHGLIVFSGGIAGDFAKKPQYKSLLKELFGSGLSGEDILAKFKMDEVENNLDILFAENNGPEGNAEAIRRKEALEYLNEKADYYFRKIFVDNGQVDFYRLAGVENPLLTIRVDGKTAEELWGEKYQNVTNSADKEALYKLEIINAMVNTNAHVTMDHYMINDNDQIVANGTIDLCDDRLRMERKKSLLREVEKLGTHMSELKAAFTADDPNVLPGTRNLHEEMMTKADAVMKQCNLRYGQYGLLKPALAEYEATAENYYNTQIGLMRQANKSQADINRVGKEKEKALDQVRELRNSIFKLSKGLKLENSDLEMGPEDSRQYNFSYLAIQVKTSVNLKGYAEEAAELHADEPLIEDLKWIDEVDADSNLEEEQMQQLKALCSIYEPEDLTTFEHTYEATIKEIINTQNVEGTGKTGAQIMDDNGLGDRAGTLQSYFVMYLMSEKGLSAKEALNIGKTAIPTVNPVTGEVKYPAGREQSLQYEKDFLKFIIDNPLSRQDLDKQTAEKALGNWAKIFRNAHNKMKDYVLPDIDYTDPKQVDKHFEEFRFLAILSGDAFQEYDRIIRLNKSANKYSSCGRIMSKAMGGYKNFWETYRFFSDMQGLILTGILNGYIQKRRYSNMAGFMGFERYLGGRMMNKIGGKTLGEGLSQLGPERTIMEDAVMGPHCYYKFAYATIYPVDSERYTKMGIKYLFGVNREEMERTADELLKETYISEKTKFDDTSKDKQNEFNNRKWPEGLRERFAAVGDSAQDMEHFLAEDAMTHANPNPDDEEANLNVKDWVDRSMLQMFDLGKHGLIQEYGLNDSDMFLIDGQTPAQKYAEKYAHIQDPEEREYYYKAEIIRSIASGREEVKIRSLHIENNKIVEGPTRLLYMKRDKLVEFARKYENYKLLRKNLLSRLNRMKKNLAETQENPKANFENKAGREGSEEYQAYARSLQACIDKISKWDSLADRAVYGTEIRTALQNLERDASRYYEKRKGVIFGPGSKEGAIRLVESEKASKGLVSSFYSLRTGFDSDQYLNNNHTMREASERELDSYYKLVTTGFLKVPAHSEKELEDAYARAEIKRLLDMYKNSNRVNEINTKPELKYEKNAVEYLFAHYEYLMGPTPVGQERKFFTVDDIREVEKFPERVEALAKNAPFQMSMSKDPELTVRRFEQLEADTITLTENKKKIADDILKEHGKFANYIVGNKLSVQLMRPAELEIRSVNNMEESLEKAARKQEIANRLSEVVMLQILSSKDNKTLFIRTVVTGNSSLEDGFRNTISNFIQEKGYLSNEKADDTLRRLENGDLMKEAIGQLNRKSAIDSANRQTADRVKVKETLGKVGFILTAQGNLTAKQFDDYASASNYTIQNGTSKAFSGQAGLLKQTINYTIQVPGQGENAPAQNEAKSVAVDANVYKNVGFVERNDALQSMFVLWVMADKKMDFRQALEICTLSAGQGVDAQKLNQANRFRADFYDFCRKNQVKALQDSGDKVAAEKAIAEWAKIYKAATEQMKSYQFPDINYRNIGNIRKNMKELVGISSVIGNARQEFKRMFETKKTVNAKRIASETIGREEFAACNDLWIGLDYTTSSFRQGYCAEKSKEDYVDTNTRLFAKDLLSTAVNRKMGIDDMQSIRKLTVEQIVDLAKKNNKILVSKPINSKVQVEVKSGEPDVGTLAAMNNYLTGIERSVFEKIVKKLESLKQKEAYEDVLAEQINAVVSFRDKFDYKEVKDIIENIPDGDDHVQEMLNLLNSNLGNGKSIKDWMADQFDLLFREEAGTIYNLAGVKPTDALMIENRTVSEKFRNKYAGIEDENIREQLYRLEFIKEMVIRRENLSVRTFELTDGGLVETATPAKVSLDVQALKNYIDYANAYKVCRSEIVSDLNTFKQALISTQKNKTANFSENGVTEGGDEYKKMTTDLRKLLNFLKHEDNRDITKKQIVDAFNALERSAKAYRDSHTGWFTGRWHRYGRNRLAQSRTITNLIPRLKQRFLGIRGELDNDLAIANGKLSKDAPFSRILSATEKIAEQFDLNQIEAHPDLDLHQENLIVNGNPDLNQNGPKINVNLQLPNAVQGINIEPNVGEEQPKVEVVLPVIVEPKNVESPKNEIKGKKNEPKNIIIEEEDLENEPGDSEENREKYLQDADHNMEMIGKMGKGAYTETGGINLNKARCIIRAATAQAIKAKKGKFGFHENGKSIENRIFGKKEARVGLVLMMESMSGLQIKDIILKNNIDQAMAALYNDASEEKRAIIEGQWAIEKENYKHSPDREKRNVVVDYGTSSGGLTINQGFGKKDAGLNNKTQNNNTISKKNDNQGKPFKVPGKF